MSFKALREPTQQTAIYAVFTLIGNTESVSYYANRTEAIKALRREARWIDAKKVSETAYTGEHTECWLERTTVETLGLSDEELLEHPNVSELLNHVNAYNASIR